METEETLLLLLIISLFVHWVALLQDSLINPSIRALLDVTGPFRCSGARILAGGPSGLLDFVLRALRALRPCDPRSCAHDGVHNACIRDSDC